MKGNTHETVMKTDWQETQINDENCESVIPLKVNFPSTSHMLTFIQMQNWTTCWGKKSRERNIYSY